MRHAPLQALIAQEATHAGFSTAGIASVPEPGSAEDESDRQSFAEWIEQGNAGEMEYLKRRNDAGELVRSSLRVAVPWVRSVIVCVTNYNTAQPLSIDPAPEGRGWAARYAWTGQPGNDGSLTPSAYHQVL